MSRLGEMAFRGSDDTIAAEATAPGRAALAVIRVSGQASFDICRKVVSRWPDAARDATLSDLRRDDGALLDSGIVVRYDAPASFTGEDSVEITVHGGATVPATVLAALIAAGARLANPGEFTRRAVLNGKLDLLQAEAIGDLIASSSQASQRMALEQLDGALSRRLEALRAKLVGVEALIVYDIDFPEEDDGPIAKERILAEVDALSAALDELLATADRGELVREGALVVLAGVPNAGKSSLFNALIGRRRAIVTELPGTTRDAIEAVAELAGWPLRLVDTAGLRQAAELVERLGVEVSHEYLSRADVALVCGETDDDLTLASGAVAQVGHAATVLVRTKSDLHRERTKGPLETQAIAVSAQTGAGLDTLGQAIVRALESRAGPAQSDAPILTRTRHRLQVGRAREEVLAFRTAWQERLVPPVVAAVHLRAATFALEELIGRVDVETILDEVFAKFCVGK